MTTRLTIGVTILSILLVILAALTNHLGFMWLNDGYGLHPAIAFPVATLSMLAALGIPVFYAHVCQCDIPVEAK